MLLVYVDAAIGRNSLYRGPALAEAGRYFPMEHTRFSNRQLRVDTAHIRTGVELGRIRAGQLRWSRDDGQKKDVYFFCYGKQIQRDVARQTA